MTAKNVTIAKKCFISDDSSFSCERQNDCKVLDTGWTFLLTDAAICTGN